AGGSTPPQGEGRLQGRGDSQQGARGKILPLLVRVGRRRRPNCCMGGMAPSRALTQRKMLLCLECGGGAVRRIGLLQDASWEDGCGSPDAAWRRSLPVSPSPMSPSAKRRRRARQRKRLSHRSSPRQLQVPPPPPPCRRSRSRRLKRNPQRRPKRISLLKRHHLVPRVRPCRR